VHRAVKARAQSIANATARTAATQTQGEHIASGKPRKAAAAAQ